MSLIEEALRRVQDLRPPTPSPRKTPAYPPPPPADYSPPPKSVAARQPLELEDAAPVNPLLRGFAARWIGLLAVLGIVVGASLWMYRFVSTLHPTRVALPTPPAAPLMVASAQAPASKKVPALPPEPTLKLTGVVEGVGEPFAIINEQIVRLGEEVDGAVLVAVNDNRARLRRRDSNEEVNLQTIR